MKKVKRALCVATAAVLALMSVSVVSAQEDAVEQDVDFELKLIESETGEDLFEKVKTGEEDCYLDEFEETVSVGFQADLEMHAADGKEYSYIFSEVIDGEKVVLSEGMENLYEIFFDAPGEKLYEVSVLDNGALLDTKKVTFTIEESENREDEERSQMLPDDVQNPKPREKMAGKIVSTKSTAEYVDRAVTLTADVTGGSGTIFYQFTEDYAGNMKIVKEYGTDNAYSFMTEGIGTHVYYVDVRDESGETVRLTYTMEVVPHPDYRLTGTLTSSKTPNEYENRGVTLNVLVEKGYGNYRYEFRDTYNGETKIVQQSGPENTYSFKTSGVGTHIYRAIITDSAGQSLTLTYTMKVVKEPGEETVPSEMGTLTSSKSAAEYVNRGVTLTANVSGDNQYRFTEEYDGKTTIVQHYSEKNTYSFTTEKIGDHIFYADIKDSNGKIMRLTYRMTVVAQPDYRLSGKLISSKTPNEYENRGVTLTADVAKGYGGYKYEFRETYNGQTKTVQKSGNTNFYSFKTSGVGTHIYSVVITDKANQSTTLNYTLNAVKEPGQTFAGTLTSSKTAAEYVDRSITLTAGVTGGNGEKQYRFTEEFQGKSKVIQEYSNKNTYTFKTKEIGEHTYYVDVKDNIGKTLRLSYTMTVVAHPYYKLSGKLTSSKTANEYENRSVTLTAEAAGGYGDYRYKFEETYNGKTKTVQEEDTDNTYAFKTTGVGSHVYQVTITDKAGQSLTLDYEMKVVKEPVATEMTGTLTSSRTTAEYVDRTVVLTANVTGGTGERKYQFSEKYNGKTNIVREYSANNTFSFKTGEVGEHTYYVDVKDSEGKTLQLSYTMIVVAHPDSLLTVKLQSSKTVNEYVNRGITLTAEATGGYGKNMQYQFSESYNGKTTVLKPYSSDNTYSFTTKYVGKHIYYVSVRDSENQSATAFYAMTVVEDPATNFKVSLKSSGDGNEVSKTKVKLTANASGGYGNYQYEFVREIDGQTKTVRRYSNDPEYVFETYLPGNYTYYVNVKDASNNVKQTSVDISVDSDGTVFKGIDVSAYQGDIDWKKVKDEKVSFAMLRILQGTMNTLKVDEKFYQNIERATKNGIAVGVYRYGYAMNKEEAAKEANMVVETLKKSGVDITLPVAYDMEDIATQGTLTTDERTEILKTFQNIVENNGYKFMIYANKSWLDTKIDMDEFSDEDIWIARYRDNSPDLGHGYDGPGNVTMWQYTAYAGIPGIVGNVDMNIGYGKY